MLNDASQIDPGSLLLDRIARNLRERPAHLAVEFRGQGITYAELMTSAARIATGLRAVGVGRDVMVPLWIDSSPGMIAAALGVLLAGGAYVGMDIDDPARRAAGILADCKAPVILTTRDLAPGLPRVSTQTMIVETTSSDPADIELPDVRAADLCYATFTSGSTGAPKGALVEHGGVTNLVAWYQREFGLGPADRMPQLAKPSFDGWALEVWPCLAAGGTLCLTGGKVPDSPQDLVDWLDRQRISVGFFTTALAMPMLASAWPADSAFRAMLLGGEKLHQPPAIQPTFRLCHVYGPTETTMLATFGDIGNDAPRDTAPPIGMPLPGLTAHVLDGERGPVSYGEPGELHIEGTGVGRGYLNRPELTADRFYLSPRGQRVYATGDVVRRLPDGRLEFIGRIDGQIKLRGFRIEPGEIEAAMLRVTGVDQAAAVVNERPGECDPQTRRLIGYWTGAEQSRVRDELADLLPPYMIPHALIRLAALPLTPHGKVDRAALAALPFPGAESAAAPPSYSTATERLLAEVWSEVLGRPAVRRDDSFFDLGGDSLLAMRAASAARRRGLRLAAADLFETDILSELAVALSTADDGSGEG